MSIICETDNFIVIAATLPHVYVSREEGGHIQIKPKVPVHDRTQLSLDLATEYIFLSMVVGEALQSALGRRGINIGLVNYQEMGNWSVFKPEGPKMHMHLFGRAIDAAIQKYGEGVLLPHLDTGFMMHSSRSMTKTLLSCVQILRNYLSLKSIRAELV